MKLILANNQTERFVSFYNDLKTKSDEPFDYAPYDSLLFTFDPDDETPISVRSTVTGKDLTYYDGVYLNGYLDTYEIAATTALCCQALSVPFVNQELANAPSLSKLSGYAKLMSAEVRIPRTVAGAKAAIVAANIETMNLKFPMVLKRADADRGIDNYKVHDVAEVMSLLAPHEPRSIWILQQYVDNDGFYLVSFYDQQPEFSIFRSLEARPDGNEQKAHMFKPKGGANARLIPLEELQPTIMTTSQAAMDAMNRQIGSVDILYDEATDQAYVLEVNYNPQLVTIETFKDVRIRAFLDGIKRIR